MHMVGGSEALGLALHGAPAVGRKLAKDLPAAAGVKPARQSQSPADRPNAQRSKGLKACGAGPIEQKGGHRPGSFRLIDRSAYD